MILYSRKGVLIEKVTGGYLVGGEKFSDKNEVLKHLGVYGRYSWERYFRLGRYAPKEKEVLFDLLEEFEEGIDLSKKAEDVKKLLYAGFGAWMLSSGYDPEEVLQEVYKGILIRNQGKCPWRADKSKFGYYVHMVCRGVLYNWHRKKARVKQHEKVGVRLYDDEVDIGSSNLGFEEPEEVDLDFAVMDLLKVIPEGPDTFMVRRILPYVSKGYSNSEIAKKLGLKSKDVDTARTALQGYAEVWVNGG